jgi:hypothetical protein
MGCFKRTGEGRRNKELLSMSTLSKHKPAKLDNKPLHQRREEG